MNIRESLTNQNMPLSKTQIMNNLKKVAKLAPKEIVEPKKASKSLMETITNMDPKKQINEVFNKTDIENPVVNHQTNIHKKVESKSIKEYFKERMSNMIDSKEEINELSKQTYISYAEKAKGQIPGLEGASKSAWQRANMQWNVPLNTKIAIRSKNKAERRRKGIDLSRKLRGQ